MEETNQEMQENLQENDDTPLDQVEQEQQETQENLQKLIDDVKQDYTNKLNKVIAEKDKAISERDNVIKQLLSEEGTDSKHSIADKINAKRNYKKW